MPQRPQTEKLLTHLGILNRGIKSFLFNDDTNRMYLKVKKVFGVLIRE